jgi:hypothetical protein
MLRTFTLRQSAANAIEILHIATAMQLRLRITIQNHDQ